jgi:hypothetical protein
MDTVKKTHLRGKDMISLCLRCICICRKLHTSSFLPISLTCISLTTHTYQIHKGRNVWLCLPLHCTDMILYTLPFYSFMAVWASERLYSHVFTKLILSNWGAFFKSSCEFNLYQIWQSVALDIRVCSLPYRSNLLKNVFECYFSKGWVFAMSFGSFFYYILTRKSPQKRQSVQIIFLCAMFLKSWNRGWLTHACKFYEINFISMWLTTSP